MKQDYTIYPEIKEEFEQDTYTCISYLRVYMKGRHYLMRHHQKGPLYFRAVLLAALHKNIYISSKLVDRSNPDFMLSDKTPLFELDPNQELEGERLMKRYL